MSISAPLAGDSDQRTAFRTRRFVSDTLTPGMASDIEIIDTPEFKARRAAASFLARAHYYQIKQLAEFAALSVPDPSARSEWEFVRANLTQHDAASGPRNWEDQNPLELAAQFDLAPLAPAFAKLCREAQRSPFDLDFFMRAPKPSPMLNLPFALVPVGGFGSGCQTITLATCEPYIDYLLPASWRAAIASVYKRQRVAFVYTPPDAMRRYLEFYGGHSKFEVYALEWPEAAALPPGEHARLPVPKGQFEEATPFIDVQMCQPRDEAVEMFPIQAQTQRRMIPVYGSRAAGVLTLAVAAVPDAQQKNVIKGVFGARAGTQGNLRISYVLGDAEHINSVVARGESARVDVDAIIRRLAEQQEAKGSSGGGNLSLAEIDVNALVAVSKGEVDDEDYNAVMLLHSILGGAVDLRANDVMISHHEHPPTQPGEEAKPYTRVRYKVDGKMRNHHCTFPRTLATLLINTVKVSSGINPGKLLSAADGAFSVRYCGVRWDLRVNVQNTIHGELATMRLQNASVPIRSFEELGMQERERLILENAGNRAVGFLVICGATGAGKSNTIWRLIENQDRDSKNIISLEQPVERKLDKVEQVPIGTNELNTFVDGLRAALREAPDMIIVGETRDLETLEAGMTASETGHFVATTLHASTAASAPNRLLNMGGPEGMNSRAFSLADQAYAFFAQRLVRLLCPHCALEAPMPDAASLRNLGVPAADLPRFVRFPTMRQRRKGGCPQCASVGEKGRTGIYEAILVTREVKEAICTLQSSERMTEIQREQGGRTIFEQGIEMLGAGRISLEECMYLLKH